MLTEILPFNIQFDKVAIAGATLWSLALYLAFPQKSEWVIEQLSRWFNFAERFLYTSQAEFEKTRQARESQNAFYASIFSIIPFIGIGVLFHFGVEIGLGPGWSISTGILACIGCGVYELGRRDGESQE